METTYAASWPSDTVAAQPAPVRQRSEGRVRLSVLERAGATRLDDLAEGGNLRCRLPRHGGPGLEAVLVNTAGGVACGDEFSIQMAAGPGAMLVATTPAAEKVYRSDGPVSRVAMSLSVAAGGALHWLPQETILFDRARLARSYEVDVDPDGTFLAFEALVFGRLARGEVMREGLLEDRWRVRRGGGLVYADALRLAGPMDRLLARPAVAGGHAVLATLLYVAPDAMDRLDAARALLDGGACESGASAWNGMLAIRWLARDSETLRRDATSFLIAFRGTPMPRVWAS